MLRTDKGWIRETRLWALLKRAYWMAVAFGPPASNRNPLIARFNLATTATAHRMLERLIRSHEQQRRSYEEALNHAAIASWKWHEREGCRQMATTALSQLPLDAISEETVRRAENLAVPLPSSFRACLTIRSKKREIGRETQRESESLPEWQLEDKQAGYRLADRLNIPRPRTWQRDVRFSEIERRGGIAIKPAEGVYSKGVFLVSETLRIFDVQRSRTLSGWDEMARLIQIQQDRGQLLEDQWLVEELVVGGRDDWAPADDIKCYACYGRVELILQVSRFPQLRRRWVDHHGNVVDTGKYANDYDGSMERIAAAVALAESISSEIPAPFIRVDLLSGRDGLVLGEFTPRPGAYHRFNKSTDTHLGDLFLDAEMRLQRDLLMGKSFDAFRETFPSAFSTASAGLSGQSS